MKGSGKPRPHARHSIDLDGPKEKRQWCELSIADVHPGDTVPDVGLIDSIGRSTRDGVTTGYTLVNIDGTAFTYPNGTKLQVFSLIGGTWKSISWFDLRLGMRTQVYGIVREVQKTGKGDLMFRFDQSQEFIPSTLASKVFAFVRDDG